QLVKVLDTPVGRHTIDDDEHGEQNQPEPSPDTALQKHHRQHPGQHNATQAMQQGAAQQQCGAKSGLRRRSRSAGKAPFPGALAICTAYTKANIASSLWERARATRRPFRCLTPLLQLWQIELS